ncbi:hypothetical protein Tco_0950302 [Tanacetum coccineum]
MADEQPRGCGGHRGGRVRGQPRRGVDDGEEVPQPHPARLDVHRDINHEVDGVSNSDDGEDEGLDTDSGSNKEEDDLGMKVDIPVFEGKPHPDEFIDWLHTVERQQAFIKYHNVRQVSSMSVEDFTGEFDRLRMRCNVDEEDEQRVARYLASLRPEISDVVQLQQF